MRARTWESVMPLQSSSSLILASISREGDSTLVVALFFILFSPHSAVFLSCEGTNHQSSAPVAAWMAPCSVKAYGRGPATVRRTTDLGQILVILRYGRDGDALQECRIAGVGLQGGKQCIAPQRSGT